MKLLLDLHTHSLETVGAAGSIADMQAAAQKKQLTGIAVTDVEYLNIEKVKSDLAASIPDQISAEAAADAAQHFLLIPGIEYETELGRVLGLFVEQKPYLPEYQRKGNGKWVFNQTVKAIHKSGGIAVLAQPGCAELTAEMWAEVDAWEACNSRYQCLGKLQEPQTSEPLWQLWQKKPLPAIAGSDSYFPEEIGNAWTEITVDNDFWEHTREQQLQLVRDALLREQPIMQGNVVHPYFIKLREYNISKIEGKHSRTFWLWLQQNQARRDYQKSQK